MDAYRELGVPFHLLTREFYTLVKNWLAPGGVMATNITGNTKLYLSTLATLRAVFPLVEVYPDWRDAGGAQSIIVAGPAASPGTEALMQRAVALREQRHFRYPLSDLVGGRATDQSADGDEVLTDDFAPVNLYETMPLRGQDGRNVGSSDPPSSENSTGIISFVLTLLFKSFSATTSCWASGRPTGITILPPALSWLINGGGIRSGAAVTITLSNGACLGQPELGCGTDN